MKTLMMLSIVALPLLGRGQTNDTARLLSQAEGLTQVAGSAVGRGGTPGEFYTLAQTLHRNGTESDFMHMLRSTNAVTRLMGVYCILNTHTNPPEPMLPVSLFVDMTKVWYAPGGCMITTRTVSDVAREFIRNPGCLGPPTKSK